MKRPTDHAHTLTHARGRERGREKERERKRERQRERNCAVPEHPPPRRDGHGRARRTLRRRILACINI